VADWTQLGVVRVAPEAADDKLIADCLRGQADAWEALVRRYSKLVYGAARRYGLDEDDSADVFQATWSSVWESLHEIRDRTRLAPWLLTVASRTSAQQIERRMRQRARQSSDADLERRADPSAIAQPDVLAIALDEASTVRQALERLPVRCRDLVRYLFYDPDAPSYAEIAERLKLNADSIGPLRKRCLGHLKAVLEEMGVD
jgi:RNA polymerase sigma factor (sigma-70 family)